MAKLPILDIARQAGVSQATVYRVLGNRDYVSSCTARAVIDAAAKLGFQIPRSDTPDNPHTNFKTQTIGFLLIERPLELLQRPVNIQLLSLIESRLAQHNLHLNIIQATNPDSLPPAVSPQRLDGIILLGAPVSLNQRDLLTQLPTVSIFGADYNADDLIDSVTPDYQTRAQLAVNYFARRGHQNIAFLNMQPHHIGFRSVNLAFQLYADLLNLKYHNLSHQTSALRWEEIRHQRTEIMDALIDRLISIPNHQRPTAIFTANDEMVVGLYHGLQKRDLAPMHDFDILSCDNDSTQLDQISPRPATMDLNLTAIADLVVERLLYTINTPNAFKGVKITIPPTIIPAPSRPA